MARKHEGKERLPLTKTHLPNNIGLLNIYRNVDTEIIYFDISFKNVTPRRFNRSTLLTDLKRAEKLAVEMCQQEYKVREETGLPTRAVGTIKILDAYIKDIEIKTKNNVASALSFWNGKKLRTTKYIILNHLQPSLQLQPLNKLTEIKLESFVDELRNKGLKDKTISNIKTVLKDIWKFARRNGYLSKPMPEFPTLTIKRKRKNDKGLYIEDAYAWCSKEEFDVAYETLEDALINDNFTSKSSDPHNYFVYLRWMRILMDTGIRPIIPLSVHKIEDNFIYFERFEKQIHYFGKGQQESMRAINELNDYYKMKGIDNGDSLILDVNGNEYKEGMWDKVKQRVSRRIQWSGRKDKYGRTYVPYSIRHGHISHAVAEGEPLHLIAKRCGTSVEQIMATYYEHDFFKEYDTPTPFKLN